MKISKRGKKGCILAFLALLLLSCFSLMQAQAAKGIDLNEECSLTVSVEVGSEIGSNDSYLEDFKQMSILVSVYKVADVDVSGEKFTPESDFQKMDFSKVNTKPSSVNAEDWRNLAEQAKEILQEAKPTEAGSVTIESGAASSIIEKLTPGLYLVVPEECYNPDYTVSYAFEPYLTALPSSPYTLTGTGSDEWVYDTTIGLKPDARPQYGRLNITKILQNYNATLGQATFVFHVVGVDKDGVTKYEEMESMTFTAAGSNTITLENIPAGLTVTVTEVYSGASYTVVGLGEESALIWSEAAVAAGEKEASVTFTNRYNGSNKTGYGVKNHFVSDKAGGWTWENPTTSPAK